MMNIDEGEVLTDYVFFGTNTGPWSWLPYGPKAPTTYHDGAGRS